MLDSLLITLPDDMFEHTLSFCDPAALSSIAQTNHLLHTCLSAFSKHISKRRQVLSALNRMALERMVLPHLYDEEEDFTPYDAWSLFFSDCKILQIPSGALRPVRNLPQTFYVEEIDLQPWPSHLEDEDDFDWNNPYITFNQNDDKYYGQTNAFSFIALYSSDEIQFKNGFNHMRGSGEDGDVEDEDFFHPPRGKLPSGRTWNFKRGGYL
jgi:hypothetical protein